MTKVEWKQRMAAQYYAEGLEKKRQRNMGWFLDTFLPSVASRIGNNKQYPTSCIVSEKQADVLYFYMERGSGATESFIIGNDGKTYSLEQRGKWWTLRVSNI